MTIERRAEIFGIPIPLTKKEITPHNVGVLKASYMAVGTHAVPLDPVVEIEIIDKDIISINDLKSGDSRILNQDEINQKKIKSEWIGIGLRAVYRWKPTK